jgi:serpin B
MMVGAVWLGVAGCVLAACSSTSDSPTCCGGDQFSVARSAIARVPASKVAPDDLQQAVAANNSFSVALFGQIVAQPAPANLLISPVSASLALTMAYAGANGQTRSQMANALGFAPEAEGSIFAGQNALGQALNARAAAALSHMQEVAAEAQLPKPEAGDYQLNLVSSVWGEQTYPWQKPFLDTLATNYGAGVNQQDFVHAFETARITIDDWLSSQTNNRINGLLGPGALDDSTRLVIVNALYLKLPWAKPFRESNTKPDYFDDGAGTSVSVDFMHAVQDLPYADDGQAQVLALPLANGELSVLIALPHADVSLADYEAALSAGSVALAIPKSSEQVAVSLPKIPLFTSGVSLSEPLQALGMRDAFDAGAADFSRLCAHPPDGGQLYVADVLQGSAFSLQEQGIEAAVASAVLLDDRSADVNPKVKVEVNRSFVLAIVDQSTSAVLMLGHVTDP